MKRTEQGFTLIEILIVVTVIALIAFFSVIAINSARSRMRDAKRVADVKQMQVALEDFFRENNQYPPGEALRLGDGVSTSCLTSGGFAGSCAGAGAVYMQVVPAEFTKGIGNAVQCGNPLGAGYCYSAAIGGASYRLGFELEHSIVEAGILKGANCLIPEVGIRSGQCP